MVFSRSDGARGFSTARKRQLPEYACCPVPPSRPTPASPRGSPRRRCTRSGGPCPRVGKRVRGAIYVHESAVEHIVDELTPEQRALFERARAAPDAGLYNVYRFVPASGKMALLRYRNFFDDPFPRLEASLTYDPLSDSWTVRRFDRSRNPPILHRKELLISVDHPRRSEYEALTRSLEHHGVFRGANGIGFLQAWLGRLADAGIRVESHRVVAEGETWRQSRVEPPPVRRHLTALTRYKLSAPLQALARYGYLDGSWSVFDYGCGKGSDIALLEKNGISADGWDPHYRPDATPRSADIVNLGYVINVIEDPSERAEALLRAYELAERVLCVAAMVGASESPHATRYSDGILTTRRTFQKIYRQDELRDYIESVIGEKPVPVGPGIFLVFKDEIEEHRFFEKRQRNRGTLERLINRIPRLSPDERVRALYEQHAAVLAPLWTTWLTLGRTPREDEIAEIHAVLDAFGTLRRALAFLLRVKGERDVQAAAAARKSDLTVFFAMREFERRRTYRGLPEELQRDVRAFFGSLKKARAEGRKLLFSAGDPAVVRAAGEEAVARGIGCFEGDQSLLLDTRLVAQLPPVLRVYIGCASHLYGDVLNADLVKVHIDSGKLSLMGFDDFDGCPLPRMMRRVKVRLRDQRVDVFDYGTMHPAPYLFRKSRFIAENLPNYAAQARFDATLEGLGLFDLEGYGPGPVEFEERLRAARLRVDGFDLVPLGDIPTLDDPCGRYLTFRDLVSCGETQRNQCVKNVPREPESYTALSLLVILVLDPVMEWFGGIELTYGFCSPELARRISHGIDPKRDQHAACERHSHGRMICSRGGAAVDFLVRDESMFEVAQWITRNTPFDRLYFYGDDRPVHVSHGPQQSRQVVLMLEGPSGRRVPRVMPVEKFLAWDGCEESQRR